MGNPWLDFVKKHWPASKKKGLKYSAHLKAMASKYKKQKKGGKIKKVKEDLLEEEPKKLKKRKVIYIGFCRRRNCLGRTTYSPFQ